MDASPHELAVQLVQRLESKHRRLVLAESCTGGLVAATIASIPGVSDWFCGSAVTYRERSKVEWLGVEEETLAKHTAVSEPASREMAESVLARTSEAHFAAAITGHLGPNAPSDLDGRCFCAIATRKMAEISIVSQTSTKLTASSRIQRQRQACAWLLSCLIGSIEAD